MADHPGPFTVIFTVELIYDRTGRFTYDGWATRSGPEIDGDDILDQSLDQLVTHDFPTWERDKIEMVLFLWTDADPIYDAELTKKLRELDR